MSIRKREWTTPSGVQKTAWVVDYIDAQGKRRLKTFAKKKDADQFSTTAKVEVRDGVHVADSATVTIQEAGKFWLKAGDDAGLERTTIDQRKQHLNLHIVPFAGSVKLSKISAPWVRSFQETLRENGRSAAIIKRVTVSLGSILADAQGRGLVVRNAVHELSKARSGTKASDRRSKPKLRVGVDIPTNAEIKAILEAATGRYRALLITMIFTGIRASEARGLRWEDIDLSDRRLSISQRADRYGEIGMPKSEAGQRTIPLPPFAINTLKEWKLACPMSKQDLVFPNLVGNIDNHQNMVKRGLWVAEVAAGVSVATGKIDADGKPILGPKYSG